MQRPSQLIAFFFLTITLTSCQFRCSVGDAEKDKSAQTSASKDGKPVYNNIALNTTGVDVKKAWLIFEDSGERVPAGNLVDFKSPVKLILQIDSGWNIIDKKVWLGASEQIKAENGDLLLDEKDLFAGYTDGISSVDAKTISLTAIIQPRGNQPTSFEVSFRVWDKKSDAEITGSYTLYSK